MNKKFFLDKDKLAEILHFYGLSIANFNRHLELKNQELYQISAGNQSQFSRDMLIAIVKHCPEVSPYWLITGEGSLSAGSSVHHNAAINTSGNNSPVSHNTLSVTDNADQAETTASQQRTIERLSKLLEKLSDK